MIDGVIVVNKEKGFTSHDVVAKLRGILKQKKIGHTGTLDPDATGVLPVCLGKATKLCDMFTEKDKVYRAVMLLGVETDTQDISGKVINETENPYPDRDVIVNTVKSFEGDYMQVPPMYSAIKVNGKKLYELAREGIEIDRKPRKVTIYSISDIETDGKRVSMTVQCSKGTYIRTLCHDIGQKLGVGACMESLERTKVGRFLLEDALKLSEIEELINKDAEKFMGKIISVTDIFADRPAFVTKAQYDKLLENGNAITVQCLNLDTKTVDNQILSESELADLTDMRAYRSDGKFVGIYRYCLEKRIIKCEKMF